MQKYLVEFLGTFFLVLVASFSGGNPIAIGMVITSLVYAGGHISGGHYNPAVTLAVTLRGKLEKNEAGKYVISQIMGATGAAFLFQVVKGTLFRPVPSTGVGIFPTIVIESLFTALLCYTVLLTATSKKTAGNQYFGLAIGGVILAGIYAGGPVTGGIYNPAVILGSVLTDFGNIASLLTPLVIYVVAQTLGAIISVYIFTVVSKE